ncbi:3'-5' exonuclease [Deinococcus ruber]|uniref:UvrD-like helicase C-terminal domain-containing protein n=1 Tax=Deinococcus ruber TaxID=1848197 RepID=A0A918CGN8_9DEIO|nr:3'-5' exonuclease [Deinococcus ruber]GGR23241.1 hypothetical protein GCM10008957_38980 [Deinococcus ruber]
MIAVGDPAQAIYSYAGADPRGMWRLTERIGATELPLSVSWRCPALHVELARTVNTFIESAPGAPRGTLEHHFADELSYQAGDVILSRLNSPLIRAALHLMTSGTSVNIRGRDLATRLEAAAAEAFPKPFVLDSVKELVNVFYEKRAKPFIEKAKTGDPEAKKFLTDFKDICSCLRLLGQQAAEQGVGTAQQIATLLRSLYREDADVLLSTIHRAKGLEWDRVTLLYPELMPLPSGNYEEEQCVLFVALTRSKDTLRLAYGKEAWANGERLTADKKIRTPPSAEPLEELLEDPLETPRLPLAMAAPLVPLSDVDWDAVTPHPTSAPPTPVIRPTVATPPPARVARTPTPSTPPPVTAAPASISQTPPTPIHTRIFHPRPPRDEEEELGHQMLHALSSLTLSTPVPVPTPSPERGLADHARKVRQLGQSSRLDDPRPTPLFHGQDSGSVSELRLRLDALTDNARPALREWAASSLVLLRGAPTHRVAYDAAVLDDVERAARLARVCLPLPGRPAPKSVRVIVFKDRVAWEKLGKVTHSGITSLSVTVGSEKYKFDPRSGELLGQSFTPFAPHLRPLT